MGKIRKPLKPDAKLAPKGAAKAPEKASGADGVSYSSWAAFHLLSAILLVVLIVLALRYVRSYVERQVVFAGEAPTVVLKNRPVWMGDYLAEQIIRTVRPPVS